MNAKIGQGCVRGVDSIVGGSPWARAIRDEILRIADHESNVLITGPSGTGKELVARALCAHGRRSSGPVVPVDCAALPGELFASQMFGHIKGAFTGAHYDALGAFRAASGGTIFLDEIGELGLAVQAKLLRVIQEKTVVPLGSHHGEPVDVRIIAATNRELDTELRRGRFREDLYYRLNVISLRTTALKDRPEDIEPLATRFLHRLAVEAGLPLKWLSPAALEMLRAYHWPGNVRQLHNQLERAVICTDGEWIGPEAMPELTAWADAREGLRTYVNSDTISRFGEEGEANARIDSADPTVSTLSSPTRLPTLAEVERRHLLHALQRTAFNQSAAARLLGINRHALRRRMKKYGIDETHDRRPSRPRVGSKSKGRV